MKLSKFILSVIISVIFALVYVHQQVYSIELSYKIRENRQNLLTLLDQNKFLMYNVNVLKSPEELERKLASRSSNFEIPQYCQIVQLTQPVPLRKRTSFGKLKKFFNFLEHSREAYATEAP